MIRKTKIFLGAFSLLAVSALPAESFAARDFTLVDNSTGQQFVCNSDGQGGGTPDPNCVPAVTQYCNNNTSYSSSVCFDKASQGCGGSRQGYAACVSSTTQYCNNNTSYSSSECFDRSLRSCKGFANSTLELMEAVRVRALKKE